MNGTKVFNYSDVLVTTINDNIDITNETEKTQIPKEIATHSLCYIENKNKFVTFFADFIRRIVDIFAGIVGLIILIPLTIIIYILNKVNHDDGPIFYVQERIGKNGKKFKMLKYRSMVVGAEEKLKAYLKDNPEAAKEYKTYKKLKNDPRITKIGGVLRKTSLDEFPQLLNILSGSMSLIGPRPYLQAEIEDMGEYYSIIIKNKPGLGGLWQCRGRANTTFEDRLDLDIIYYKNRSLKYDFKILCKTLLKVLKKEGAV
jgi:undecaprenyl-phosphate galactose phosphotransferase